MFAFLLCVGFSKLNDRVRAVAFLLLFLWLGLLWILEWRLCWVLWWIFWLLCWEVLESKGMVLAKSVVGECSEFFGTSNYWSLTMITFCKVDYHILLVMLGCR